MKSEAVEGAVPAEILLVEDNPGDVRLTREVLVDAKIPTNLHVAIDGPAAIEFLVRYGAYLEAPCPDLMLLDLKLPRMSGGEILKRMRQNPAWNMIPVVVLTASTADEDIVSSYRHNANGYITKPIDVAKFADALRMIDEFWPSATKLARRP